VGFDWPDQAAVCQRKPSAHDGVNDGATPPMVARIAR
jgi:hypothetical protein